MPECPACSKSLDTERGVSIHHKHSHGESISGAESDCEFCGESFSHNKGIERRFCSKNHFNQYLNTEEGRQRMEKSSNPNWKGGKRKEFECRYCGSSYSEWEYREERTNFCKESCYYAWREENIRGENHPHWSGTTDFTCEQCGKKIEMSKLQAKNRRFCSLSCYGDWISENLTGEVHPKWKPDTVSDYGSSWSKSFQDSIRKRDDFECQVCGTKQDNLPRKLDVHHIIPFSKFGVENHEEANSPDNLISLCRGCHMKVESEPSLIKV